MMLEIRPAQMKVFEEAALLRFEDEMVQHSNAFTPRLCEVLGEEQLRVALRQAMGRAMTYGFTYRGPMRLYIELMFLFGSAFDTDPQYPAIGAVLTAEGEQMQRAEQIHAGVLEYQERVAGPNGANVRRALEALAVFAAQPFSAPSEDFVSVMLQEMHRAFPQKVAYTGEERLTRLIQEGRAQAHEYKFPTIRGEALLVLLMFAFGHGCTHDPLYPWIAKTLRDERITSPAARAERLERKARTWLEHVLARPPRGGAR